MITLYKGDDTSGQLGKNVKVVFHCDDAVDMDGVTVKFDLLGIVKKSFENVHDGDELDIFISHTESRKFPLGVIFAKVWGEDASGKIRTFANRIPICVTFDLRKVYGTDGLDSQDIYVYSSVEWDSIANKPTVFPSSVEEVEGLQTALDEINEKIPEDASTENQLADKEWVDQEIDRVAAYYITSDAQGNPFQTRAALLNAETYYSGGSPRTPTRNDYAIVLADETHDDTEWRYIYSVNEQGVGTWEAQYPVEGAIVADDNVTKTSTNPVKSSGIWAAIWGALSAIPAGFTSLYDWVVAQLGQKRNYTDLSYDTPVTINAPALHAILTSSGTQILEYYLPCTEVMPATPQINHVYTWRKEGAEFYITQGVSVYSTSWRLFNSNGEQLSSVSTDNATQGWFPDLEFSTSAYSAVSSVKVDEYPGEVHDTIALRGDIPTPPSASTANPQMDGTAAPGTSAAYARGDHVHPSDTSRMAATATGADISLSGTDPTKISTALDGKIAKTGSDSTNFLEGDGDGGALVSNYNAFSFAHPATPSSAGNLAALNSNGDLMDSGKEPSDFQNALTAQQLANIAAVSDALAFDATHTYAAGDPVVYNGTLYTFTAAHTGAWTGSDVEAVDIIARLAGKANDNAVVHKDGNETIAGTKLFSGWRAYSEVATQQHFIEFSTSGESSTPFAILFQNGDANSQYRYALPLKSGVMALLSDLADYAPLNSPAFTGTPTAPTPTAGDNSTKTATTAFVQGAVPYDIGTPIVIDTASSEVVEGETVYYGAATLANRTANIVQVTAATPLDELRITFPAATSGKVRDFGLRVEIGTGSAALSAPALVPIAPTGETIKIENNAKEIPALADGTATAKGVTLLYFSENAPGVFVVKGEQVEEIA